MPRGQGTYGSKRGRPSLSGKTTAQAAAKKRIAKKKVEARKTAVKKAVKSAGTSLAKGARDSVKAMGKAATSKRLRAGLKEGLSAATGLTAVRAIGSATKRKESPADKRRKAAAKRKAQMRIKK